jgi:hypothetical protein
MQKASSRRRQTAGTPARPAVSKKERASNLVSDLGWSRKRAAQVRASLAIFEADWNAPGMEGYDEL